MCLWYVDVLNLVWPCSLVEVVEPVSALVWCRTIQDPACQRLNWYKPPLTVLVIKKIFDENIRQCFVDLIIWLIKVFTLHQHLTQFRGFAKKQIPKIRDYQVSLEDFFCGKSSQNGPKPVLIFWSSIKCVGLNEWQSGHHENGQGKAAGKT